jgi:hypothetical protein
MNHTGETFNSIEQSPSEADSRSGDQEIPCLLRNSKDHYRFHRSPAQDPIVSQMNPAHTLLL